MGGRTQDGDASPSTLYRPSMPHFLTYNGYPTETLTTVRRVLTAAQKRIGKIYLFDRPSDPEYCKIGFTNKLVQERFKYLQQRCKYVPHLGHKVEDVPNAKHVVHIELMQYRRKERCCRHNPDCVRQHEEWFEIDVEQAAQVMDRWVKWVRDARPYDEEVF
jgi:T5orf172 domain